MKPTPMRIVGVAADIDDEHLVPGPTLTVYMPFGQGPLFGGRLFVHVRSDPYALITPITRTIRNLSVDQPVERAATLEDVRAEVLTPDRLNAMVFGGFAMVALTIAVVGVAGVLAFSVSARTREFGIRLAIGSQPRHLLARVIAEGTVITALGIGAGLACGFVLQRAGRQLFRERANAGGVGGGWGGGRIAGSGRGGVGVAGDAGRARGCDSGATRGLRRVGQYLAGGFRPKNGEAGVCEQSKLLQHRSLIPINMFMRKLAIAEANDCDQRHFHTAIGRRNPR